MTRKNLCRILLAGWLGGGLMGGIATPLLSQDYRTFGQELDLIRARARWRFGPARVIPSLQFNFGYESNVFGTAPGPDRISDYVAAVSVPVSFYLLHRDWFIFSLLENPQYVYFFETVSQRALNNSYTPALRLLLFRRFSFSGSYQYSRAKERWLPELDTRVVQEVKGWNGSLFYETMRNSAVGVSWSDLRVRYQDIRFPGLDLLISRGLNRREKSARAELYYTVFANSSLFANFGRTEYRFEDPQASFKNSSADQFNLGVRFPALGRIRGTLSFGYKKYIPRQEEQAGFSGLVGNTNVEVRLGRLNLRVSYIRDIPFSSDLENIYYRVDDYGFGLSFYLSQGLRLDYGYAYGQNAYPSARVDTLPVEGNPTFGRKENVRNHSGGLVFRVFKSTGIGITVSYFGRKSNFYSGDRNRVLAGAFITYDF